AHQRGRERRRRFREQAERHAALQEQRLACPAAQRHDRAAVLRRKLPRLARGRYRLSVVDDHGGREARIPGELVAQVGLDQLQRAETSTTPEAMSTTPAAAYYGACGLSGWRIAACACGTTFRSPSRPRAKPSCACCTPESAIPISSSRAGTTRSPGSPVTSSSASSSEVPWRSSATESSVRSMPCAAPAERASRAGAPTASGARCSVS